MAKNHRYFKLGQKSSVYFDPSSRVKVTPTTPGMLHKDKTMNPKMKEHLASGHITEIDKDEYDEMMATHQETCIANDEATKNKKKGIKTEVIPPDDEEEEGSDDDDEEEEGSDDDDEEEVAEKPAKKGKGKKKK